MQKLRIIPLVLAAIFWSEFAQSADIGYSGRLTDGTGKPRGGAVDLEFKFFDDESAGVQLGSTINIDDVPLAQGLFTVTLIIPDNTTAAVFGGAETWIQVKDKTNGFTHLRQRFLPVPLALRVPVDGMTMSYDNNGKLRMGPVAPGVSSFLKIDAGGNLIWEAAGSGSLNPNDVNTAAIQDGAVTLAKLDDDAVDSDKIVDGSVANVDIAALDAAKLTGNIAFARLPVGATGSTVAVGNDARFSDARAPNGTAGGKLSGTYPNPGVNLADTDIPTLTSAKISDFATAAAAQDTNAKTLCADGEFLRGETATTCRTAAQIVTDGSGLTAESDPQVGANTTDYLSKWNGSALVASSVYESGGVVGIGTASPTARFSIVGNAAAILDLKTGTTDHGYIGLYTDAADQTSRTAYIGFPSAGSEVLSINNAYTGGSLGFYTGAPGAPKMSVDSTGNVGIGTMTAGAKFTVTSTSTATGGSVSNTVINPTYNQASGTAANTDLLIYRTETAAGSGEQKLIDAKVNTASKFTVFNDGYAQLQHTNGGQIQLNPLDGAIELFSGNNGASYIDFKGSANLATDFQGRISYNDGVGFGFKVAASGSDQVTINESGKVNIGAAGGTGKLVADGVIESTSGGFKFPDGSVQTIAATSGAGKVAQVVYAMDNTFITSAVTIPHDDTIPQSTEGVQVLTLAITPTNAASVLMIEAQVTVTEPSNTGDTITVALFKDADANALATATANVDAYAFYGSHTVSFKHFVTAGSTAARTYKIRAGNNAGTININGRVGARVLGGSTYSLLQATEITP